jgi:sugar lactone lactonase YvrE
MPPIAQPEPAPDWQGTDLSPGPRAEPDEPDQSTTIQAPEPDPTLCAEHTPGIMCVWMGVEGVPFFGAEGLPRTESELYSPLDITWGPDGLPYVVDWNNHRIRVVHPDDTVWTIAGTGLVGDGFYDPIGDTWTDDGPATAYRMDHPSDLAVDPLDPSFLYIAGWHNSRILRYNFATLQVEYFAGNGTRAFCGDGGQAADACIDLPSSAAFDGAGNLFVSAQGSQVIRRISSAGDIETIAGIPRSAGYDGDGLPALETRIGGPTHGANPSDKMAFFGGVLYFVDSSNHLVRRIDPGGTIERVAGIYQSNLIDTDGDGVGDLDLRLGGYSGDGGPAVEAELNDPQDLVFAEDGTMYVADTGNHCIRVLTPDGIIDTFAGVCGVRWLAFPGDPSQAEGRPAREALLSDPFGVALDPAGNVYIADTPNHVIRVVWR